MTIWEPKGRLTRRRAIVQPQKAPPGHQELTIKSQLLLFVPVASGVLPPASNTNWRGAGGGGKGTWEKPVLFPVHQIKGVSSGAGEVKEIYQGTGHHGDLRQLLNIPETSGIRLKRNPEGSL